MINLSGETLWTYVPFGGRQALIVNKWHKELHSLGHSGWLRAAVLGANDGIVSIASLLLGVASAHAGHGSILLSGTAGLVAGAMSMATGEYVSVSSQSDTEKAALAEERAELHTDFQSEHQELTLIYVQRGLSAPLAHQVAEQLMAHDALGAHARDELGISALTTARPLLAASTSALSFAVGAALPLVIAAVIPERWLIISIALSVLVCLAFLGGFAAWVGRAPVRAGIIRITFWSSMAMIVSSGAGVLFSSMMGQ